MGHSPSERTRALALAVLSVTLGLSSRLPGLPGFVKLYVGDVLWGAFFFQLFRFACPQFPRTRLWLLSLTTTELIEFSQLYRAPWLDALRSTPLGGLLLGHQFLVSDVVCVALGATAAALSACRRPQRGRARNP